MLAPQIRRRQNQHLFLRRKQVVRRPVENHVVNPQRLHVQPRKHPLVAAEIAPGYLAPAARARNRRRRVAPAPGAVAEAPGLPGAGVFEAADGDAVQEQVGDEVAVEDC